MFMLFCELKLMLTPVYFLIYNDHTHGDRIKHNFLSHLLTHCIIQSFPMTIYQGISYLKDQKSFLSYLSPLVSLAVFIYGFFVIKLIRQMNSGGLTWIQKPKPTLQFYSMSPVTLISDD